MLNIARLTFQSFALVMISPIINDMRKRRSPSANAAKKSKHLKPNDELEIETEILAENTIPDVFTNKPVKFTDKEQTLQQVAQVLQNEYNFSHEEMTRDYSVGIETSTSDGKPKKSKRKADIVVFDESAEQQDDNVIRVCIIAPKGTRGTDPKSGVQALEDVMGALKNCEFGLWTNSEEITYFQKDTSGVEPRYEEIADFPGKGESLEELGQRRVLRVAAGQSLLQTFRRCHDYIYGNQGLKKDAAFWEFLNLTFCKIYDERHSPRRFWVGVKERNTSEGQHVIAERIRSLFNDVKRAEEYKGIFDSNSEIRLNDRVLAYIAAQLSRYSILQATIDVKGSAYEEITSHTLKQQRGQFFTPRNIVKFVVDMLNPKEGQRIIDPACGSGGFLVEALDHIREQVLDDAYPHAKSKYERIQLKERPEVVDRMRKWASSCVFGIDFDPDLKRAARMNMVMNNDGHGNIFSFNSLEFPQGNESDILEARQKARFETFDFVFTNPPFGTKIPIDDPGILEHFELARRWKKNERGEWLDSGRQAKVPPEILFIERCYHFLKPRTGKMGIVLPDSILGNPELEYVRAWILRKMELLASIDLPVEAFLPQVGVQASLLFLRRKSDEELAAEGMGRKTEYAVFMAVAEKVGRDRRGNTVYMRDADGAESFFDEPEEEIYIRNGKSQVRMVSRSRKKVDDDLARIHVAYRQYLKTGHIPEIES